jgi:hypothetical protein
LGNDFLGWDWWHRILQLTKLTCDFSRENIDASAEELSELDEDATQFDRQSAILTSQYLPALDIGRSKSFEPWPVENDVPPDDVNGGSHKEATHFSVSLPVDSRWTARFEISVVGSAQATVRSGRCFR